MVIFVSLVWEKKKLGGILTQLSPNPESGLTDYAIIGIGINCCQKPADFPPELQNMAASLSMAGGKPVTPACLAAAMIDSLVDMDRILLSQRNAIMDRYKKDCITLGQDIMLVQGENTSYGTATDLDAEGGLIVRFADGSTKTVTSGEVSVRGMYGYI